MLWSFLKGFVGAFAARWTYMAARDHMENARKQTELLERMSRRS